MKSLRKENGITLVALVVTIIVLLILAGVSLSLVAGSNGIITKATTAADANTVATAKEQVTLMIAEWTTDFYEKVYADKSVDINVKAGDWITQEHPGNIKGKETGEVSADNPKANLTTDDYNFTISGDKGTNHKITITGTKIKGGSTNRDATNGLDKRLSEDITGTLTPDGKLSWD